MIFTGCLFLVFILLTCLFPYSGDDWAWGSKIGLDRLASCFENYNGRYAGNLLVMVLTRCSAVNVLFRAACLVGICFLPKCFSNSQKMFPYLLAALLVFLMPGQMFVQSVAWTAGFSNYVPPIMLALGYLVLTVNIFEEEPPQYSAADSLIALLIGFIGALFMENVTLYSIAISGVVILFVLVKFRRIYAVHLLHFVGSFLGAVLMFTNTAYRTIANGDDGYRSMAIGNGLKETMLSHANTVFQQFFSNNVVALSVFSLLCFGIYLTFIKSQSASKRKNFAAVLVACNIFSMCLLYARYIFPNWLAFSTKPGLKTVMTLLFVIVAVIYAGSAFLCVILCVTDNKTRWKAIFLLGSIPILIAPLLLVSPIGPRCFFPPYLMLIAACTLLADYLQRQLSIDRSIEKSIEMVVVASIMAMVVFFTGLYGTNRFYDVKRNEYAKKQIEAGCEKITICELPYSTWVWCSSPAQSPWNERYKLFHGIDKELELILLPYDQFDEWTKEFDQS